MHDTNLAYVMVSLFINIQLIINNCQSKGFPDQIMIYIYALLLVRIAQLDESLTNSFCLVLSQNIAGSNLAMYYCFSLTFPVNPRLSTFIR